MTVIDEGAALIAGMLNALVQQMRERGHEKATARFWIEHGRADGHLYVVHLQTHGVGGFERYGHVCDFVFCDGETAEEALGDACAEVTHMMESDSRRCAAWFETAPPAPAGSGGPINGAAGAAATSSTELPQPHPSTLTADGGGPASFPLGQRAAAENSPSPPPPGEGGAPAGTPGKAGGGVARFMRGLSHAIPSPETDHHG